MCAGTNVPLRWRNARTSCLRLVAVAVVIHISGLRRLFWNAVLVLLCRGCLLLRRRAQSHCVLWQSGALPLLRLVLVLRRPCILRLLGLRYGWALNCVYGHGAPLLQTLLSARPRQNFNREKDRGRPKTGRDAKRPRSGRVSGAVRLTEAGRRGRTRTCNRRIRNPMLYPFELRARLAKSTIVRVCASLIVRQNFQETIWPPAAPKYLSVCRLSSGPALPQQTFWFPGGRS
jgi:hypothetical protein